MTACLARVLVGLAGVYWPGDGATPLHSRMACGGRYDASTPEGNMDLTNSFEQMIVNIGNLDVPKGIGILVAFTDGKQLKWVWNNLAIEHAIQLLDQVRAQVEAVRQGQQPPPTVLPSPVSN